MVHRSVRNRSIRRNSSHLAMVASAIPLLLVACGGGSSGTAYPIAQGGTNVSPSSGGAPGQGGAQQSGGVVGNGGNALGQGGNVVGGSSATNSGGAVAGGNTAIIGGNQATGGSSASGATTGGSKAAGGAATGGNKAAGGAATGGNKAAGGAATGGNKATGGTATGGSSSSGVCKFPAAHTNNGSSTWYTLSQGTTLVNCSFPTQRTAETVSYVANSGTYFAALNTAEYANAAACGACVEVTRDNSKTVVVTIADQCPVGSNPKCTPGHVDLARPAFLLLGTEAEGYLGTGNGGAVGIISWRYVPCTVTGNVHILLKEPSNAGWNEFLVANHRIQVAKFEAQINGSWVTGTRQTYNYFNVGASVSFPVPVRITDINGAVITGTVQSGVADQDIGSQFPTCT